MKVTIYKGYWTVAAAKKNKSYMFIYGDNNVGFGHGGQAIIRSEPNAFGIPTKKYPDNDPTSFYTDDEYEDNVKNISNAMLKIIKVLTDKKNKFEGIILPENGLGTGLANLPNKAPKTYDYLKRTMKDFIKFVKSIDK